MRRRQGEELTKKALEELGWNEDSMEKLTAIAQYFCEWGMLLMALRIQECTEDMEDFNEILDYIDSAVRENGGGCDDHLIGVCGPHFQKFVEEDLSHRCFND